MAGASGILAMLGKPKGGGSKGPLAPAAEPEAASDETGDALMEMFDALQAGDSSGASLAFKRAYASCESGGEPDMSMGDDETEGDDDLDL